jgi:hypothetical protein
MPKIYRQDCKNCGKYYESQNGTYCSKACYKADDSWKKELSRAYKGKHHSPNTEFKKGQINPLKGKPNHKMRGENNPAWKGKEVSYAALHAWVKKNYGAPSMCTFCGDKSANRYEWANISGEYMRERHDWIRLCVKCHRREAAGHILITHGEV